MEGLVFSNAASLMSTTLPKIHSFTDIAQIISHSIQNFPLFPEKFEMGTYSFTFFQYHSRDHFFFIKTNGQLCPKLTIKTPEGHH